MASTPESIAQKDILIFRRFAGFDAVFKASAGLAESDLVTGALRPDAIALLGVPE